MYCERFNDTERFDQVFLEEYLKPYLVDLFRDLARRCKQQSSNKKVIDKITLIEYFRLPILFGERFFSVITSSNEKMNEKNFIRSLTKVYASDVDTKLKLAFSM